MTYEEAIRWAVPKLTDKHLAGYVRGYEGGTLRPMCGECAVGHMMAEELGCGESDGYRAYGDMLRDRFGSFLASGRREGNPLATVEIVFEGFGIGFDDHDTDAATRARLIYDACIEEQTRRASLRTPTPEAVCVAS